MSLDRLRRVVWRLREKSPDPNTPISIKLIKKAIYMECGTDPRTVKVNMATLVELGLIKRFSRYSYKWKDPNLILL